MSTIEKPVVKKQEKPVVTKVKKPSINWKEIATELKQKNEQLLKANEVNEHELIMIAKQRDEAVRSNRENIAKVATAEVIVDLNNRKNTAINDILRATAELNLVTSNYEYILSVDNKLIGRE